MSAEKLSRLSAHEVDQLDPYAFMAVIGKKVIHPGGKRSTEKLFRLADFAPGKRVLDVGAGVGTTAIDIANRFGCEVTAVDIDPGMLARAEINVRAAKMDGQVTIAEADIQSLPFVADSFDRVVVEAVTMFVDRPRAAAEVVRVCRPEGRVLEHEFIYRKPPTQEVRRIFEGEICPGVTFDGPADWVDLYETAGLGEMTYVTGPFAMMYPQGMVRDEGIGHLSVIMARTMTCPAYLKKMCWMMPRMLRVMSYLGYVALVGVKPAAGSSDALAAQDLGKHPLPTEREGLQLATAGTTDDIIPQPKLGRCGQGESQG